MENTMLKDFEAVNRCLLCMDAPCSKACYKDIPVADALRSLYFANLRGAVAKLGGKSCLHCDAPCEKACLLSTYTHPVTIKDIMQGLEEEKDTYASIKLDKVDISAEICGVKLENPFLLSSSVVGSNYEMVAKAFEAGWAGVAFKTIANFPQHETSPRFSVIRGHNQAFAGFKNIEQLSDHSVEENMEIFRRLKKDYPTKVIVASIMGRNEEEWSRLAATCEEAGADVIECNFSCPNMEDNELGSTIGQSAELVERFTRAVKRGTRMPVLAKLTPNIMDMVPIALAAKRGGADGIAAINTINSITGINLRNMVAEPDVNGHSMVGGYSGRAVKPIALRFISDLGNCKELEGLHISGMGGIENWRDACEFIALGAGSLQVTTAIMQYGYRIIDDLIDGLTRYYQYAGISNISMLIGKACKTIVPHSSVERDTVLFPVIDKDKCIGCGRCYLSCYDGGHQAIEFDEETRLPRILGAKCVGCHLCKLVCPVRAIGVAKKRIIK